jgi:hypothetical protein
MKAFFRMSSGVDLKKYGWYGDGGAESIKVLMRFSQTLRALFARRMPTCTLPTGTAVRGRTTSSSEPMERLHPNFPMYPSTFDWGNIDTPKFDSHQLKDMKKTCQHHCFSTLNHNLGYCYNDARVIKWVWKQAVTNKFKGGARSFED